MIDLDKEFGLAISCFNRAGVHLPGRACLYIPAVGLERIENDSDLYQPSDQGERALIIPIFEGPMPCFVQPQDEQPDLIDLAALSPTDPARWWRRTGVADYLNEHLIGAAVTWGHSLQVHATPWQWLQANCQGVCPLTSDYSALRCVRELLFDDPQFGARVRRSLAHPFPIPRIRVLARAQAA